MQVLCRFGSIETQDDYNGIHDQVKDFYNLQFQESLYVTTKVHG